MATKIIVKLPEEHDYAVRIGAGTIADLGQSLTEIESLADTKELLVISDANVAPLYLARTKQALLQAGYRVSDMLISAGEDSKTIEVAAEIWNAMAQLKLNRSCAVIALGGGVICDLAGFVAASYMRGVPLIYVPTTLLAMVDAAVGGKTAVNLAAGKNLVGLFRQPVFVCVDTDVLSSLPDREWRCGSAEIAKMAVLDSDEFFFWLCDHAHDVRQGNSESVHEAIKRSLVFKASIVARDKHDEKGIRACLNYGHTLGHALERTAGYGVLSHGEAVAEGMRFAAHCVLQRGSASPDFVEAQNDLLDTLGLSSCGISASVDNLIDAMKLDKKAYGKDVRFVLVDDIGSWSLVALSDTVLRSYLASWLAEGK